MGGVTNLLFWFSSAFISYWAAPRLGRYRPSHGTGCFFAVC